MATQKILLNGKCKLYAFPSESAPSLPQFGNAKPLEATIPGNVELDLMAAGILPDLYFADNVSSAEAYEGYDWWYEKEFELSSLPESGEAWLRFNGIDTIAECFLNGVKLGATDNMFVEHEFDVTSLLKQGKNVYAVHIYSAAKHAEKFDGSSYFLAFPECYDNLHVRKASHTYGWDIMPRLMSAGIWRDVELILKPQVRLTQVHFDTMFVKENLLGLKIFYDTSVPSTDYKHYTVKFDICADGSEYHLEYPLRSKFGAAFPYLKDVKLWWPNGYGEQNLYDVTASLMKDGVAVDSQSFRFGFRHIKLHRSAIAQENGFYFTVNNEKIFCKGANWVPLDVLHSRDKAKYYECVKNYHDSNCNMVRVWGGGVYEDEEFFEYCDQFGILVWQDIMLSCHSYPMNEAFCNALSTEVKKFARKVRNHPSLALYCGSNETDWSFFCVGLDPANDKLTRKVIPEALFEEDPHRDYVPSSPYFTPETVEKYGGRFSLDLSDHEYQRQELPEEQYWWHRDDFRGFATQKHNFIAEIGYSGAPNLESMEKFLPKDAISDFDSPAWKAHSYSTDGNLTHSVTHYFGEMPEAFGDYIFASQCSQAEAYKYLMETTRIRRKWCSGILLWNMRDAWPEMTSSLVDYYGSKKLAFYVVKNSNEPLQVLFEEKDGKAYILLSNDTMRDEVGEYRILNADGKVVLEGKASFGKNANTLVGELPIDGIYYSELTVNGKTTYNYFKPLNAPFVLQEYKAIMAKVIK